MLRTLLLFLLFFNSISKAQLSKLVANISVYETDTCFTFNLLKDDILIYEEDFTINTKIVRDSLDFGAYKINIYTKGNEEPYLTKYISLLPFQITDIDINLSWTNSFNDIDPKTREAIRHQSFEMQFGLGYFNDSWVNKNSRLKNNYSGSASFYLCEAFSKHMGFLAGGGISFSQNYFTKDTGYFSNQIIYERYNNISLNLEVKFRFSSGNQRLSSHYPGKFFLDVGAGYALPLSFRHTIYYKGNTKVTDKYIHQFTDFRAFANLGYKAFSVFAEYRLSDFLLGKHQEVPLYNFGIRLIAGAY